MAVLRQTNLTLVVAQSAGHDPIRATGLLLTHLSYIARETTADEAQVWRLVAQNRPANEPGQFLEAIAAHQNRDVDDVWQEARLTSAELADDPLAL